VSVEILSDAASERPVAQAGAQASGIERCIVQRSDGVYADPSVLGTTLGAAVDRVFSGGQFFVGLDYGVLLKLIYDVGPDLQRSATGPTLVRLASAIAPFEPERRELYKALKIRDGQAQYYFQPVFRADPDDPHGDGIPDQLRVDEFVADVWSKGVRFGVDVVAVRQAIALSKSEWVVVARRLDAILGQDAQIIEVSEDLHRSDAPRQLANGKLDLMAFQNRFPQVQKGKRLLQKVPRKAGLPGFEINGVVIEPPIPVDVDMSPMAGLGTMVERTGEGEFLVAQQDGFLNVDTKTSQLSVGAKIVSREGVSARTTGNLQLSGDFEEFGEVQEKRLVEGESITVHADVFGNIVSRGGTILLNQNLVGGSAINARGPIVVRGVASGAVIQCRQGEVRLARAESCIVSGTRVVIEHATNCEVIAEEVLIQQAEGCAIAGRRVHIEVAGPRKEYEMVVHALQPDSAQVDQVITAMRERVAQFAQVVAQRKQLMEELTSQPDVRKYLLLASKVRKKEITLTAEQMPQFQKMAQAVGPALKNISKVSLDIKAAETEQQAGEALVNQLMEQRTACAGESRVRLDQLSGDTVVRAMVYQPDGSSLYDFPPKDIKQRLRPVSSTGAVLFAGSRGPVDWKIDG
jgi:hypothetical protein